MPATFTGPLARRLDGISALRVQEVRGPIAIQPGHVYIGCGDADIIISRRASALLAMAAPRSGRLPLAPQHGPIGPERIEPYACEPVDRHTYDGHGE